MFIKNGDLTDITIIHLDDTNDKAKKSLAKAKKVVSEKNAGKKEVVEEETK